MSHWKQGLALAAVAVVAVLAGCAPVAQETPSDAVLLPVPDDATVTFSVWFKVGSQNDPAGKEGLASLTGEMLAGGATTNNTYEQILEKLYPLASSYSVRTDKEMTTITGRTHKDNLDVFFGLFTDAFLRPAFDEEDFNRLKSDQLNYLKTTLRYNSDEELGKIALEGAIFENTRYFHPVAGTVQGLESITVDDVELFYSTWYTGENATVALGGGYDDELLSRFEATLAELPTGTPPAAPSIEVPAIKGRQVVLVQKDGADASISFGFPIDVQRGERDFYALWIANSWLGEHRNSSSNLFQVIRETRGMNYGDYSYIEAFPLGGFRQMPPANVARNHQIFQVWIRTLPNEQALFALRAAVREVQDLIDNGMSEEEFELTRSFLSKYYLHFAETTQSRLGYRVDDAFYGIEGDGHLAQFGEMMASLTREDVNAALERHLQYDQMIIAIVTGQAEELAAAMAADTPSPMSYPTPKSDEVLEEDKVIESWPLAITAGGIRTIAVDDVFEH